MAPGTTWLARLAELVLPRHCVGCGAPVAGSALCRRCRPAGPPVTVRSVAGRTVAAGPYEGALRTALLAYKERGRRDLAAVLGQLLSAAVLGVLADRGLPPGAPVQQAVPRPGQPSGSWSSGSWSARWAGPPPAVALVPVPSRPAVAAARGGDHVLRLCHRAGAALGLPVQAPLRFTRAVRDSAGLGAAERADNLAAAMTATPPGRIAAAVLVDDIVTTGATLREAGRALQGAGWQVWGRATVAATSRRGRDP